MTAYVVFTREKTNDAAELKLYGEQASAAREGHAMTPLAFYGPIEMLEGIAVEGCLILAFPSVAEAHGWYDSPIYQAAKEHRVKGAEYRVFIVEGLGAG